MPSTFVEPAVAHDELGVRVRGEELAQLFVGGVDVDPFDVGARRHDRRDALIAELEHALHDVLFGRRRPRRSRRPG